jgi:hypothetical protein
MAKKRSAVLSQDDIATICDVYDEMQLGFDPNDFLSSLFGSGKVARGVVVNNETKWWRINQKPLLKIVEGMTKNGGVGVKWSSANLLNKLEDVLLTNKAKGVSDIRQELQVFCSDISEKPPVEYVVCMPIYGVSITKDRCISVGKYSFVHADYLTQKKFTRILGVNPSASPDSPDNFWHTECFVCVDVCACEDTKAKELAMAEFKWIENAIRFSLPSKMYGAGITSYDDKRIERIVVAVKGSDIAGLSSSVKGPLMPIKIESIAYTREFRCMLEVLGKPSAQLTELQKRIKHAIYLCGLSMQSTELSVSYFLCVAAMEALFCKQENPYVSPSIAQQIIESFCFLIVEESNRRLCFDELRNLYGNRSAIVHGGEKELTEEDVIKVRMFLMVAINKLLTDDTLSKMPTLYSLQELVKDLKFGKHIMKETMR